MLTGDLEIIRVAAAVPRIKVGDPKYNVKEIVSAVKKSYIKHQTRVMVFPELSLTGYTCGDLFNQRALIDATEEALKQLLQETEEDSVLIAVGMPIKADNQLFSCAVLILEGKILGVVPRTFMASYNEFNEKRWFASSVNRISNKITLCGQEVSFNENLLFKDNRSSLCVGIDIGEDLWVPIPPSCYHTMYGANLILNLSASNEVAAKTEYRKDLVRMQSAKCITAYSYASSGQTESTTDLVFSGHSLIAENGHVVAECRFEHSKIIIADIDIENINNDRVKFNSYMGRIEKKDYTIINFALGCSDDTRLQKSVDARPFVPSDKPSRTKRCKEIFKIQSIGLYERLEKTEIKKAVIGVSGKMGSILALLVTTEAFKNLKLPMRNITGVIVTGFQTQDRIYTNALTLMEQLGISVKEVPLKESWIGCSKDLSEGINVNSIIYNNEWLRERAQILMDIADKEGALVVGTGDLSELALGWCTYKSDHMSMYDVNANIPKTLLRYLVEWYSDTTTNKMAASILKGICSLYMTLGNEKGNNTENAEDLEGPYELHDFFLYNMLRHGCSPKKIFYLAKLAFKDKYEEKIILQWLKIFYKRFFSQQFKRSCLPDGVKVGSIGLSPRGDWHMPSDACCELWLEQLEKM